MVRASDKSGETSVILEQSSAHIAIRFHQEDVTPTPKPFSRTIMIIDCEGSSFASLRIGRTHCVGY